MRFSTFFLAFIIAISSLGMGCTTPAERARIEREKKQKKLAKQKEYCKKSAGEAGVEHFGALSEMGGGSDPYMGLFIVTSLVGSSLTAPFATSSHLTQCKDGRPRRTSHFIAETRYNLLADASRGGGEYLESLSELFEFSKEEQENFTLQMRANLNYPESRNVSEFVEQVYYLESQSKKQSRLFE